MLKQKVILVTGSTTGIGKAIAERCVKEGAKVMIHGTKEDVAEQVSRELGSHTAYCVHDLEKEPTSDRCVRATIETFGRIDGLINNAGIYPRNNLENLDETLFEQVVAVNMKAPLFLCQHAVDAFKRQEGGGAILNIGSINAHCGERVLLVYSMTKGALMTMTRNLADALGTEKIRVNQLNVGWTLTENEIFTKMTGGFPDDWEKKLPYTYAPTGKLLRPDEIAAHAVFWISDQSAPANGVVYELEQYPVIGRNLISELSLSA